MTPTQIRAARGLLNWTVQELAEKVGIDRNTIAKIESGAYASDAETLAAICRVLEAAGVEFTNGRWPGVRLRPDRIRP
jgi:transcriptional regulator with XRE-family HTH domain